MQQRSTIQEYISFWVQNHVQKILFKFLSICFLSFVALGQHRPWVLCRDLCCAKIFVVLSAEQASSFRHLLSSLTAFYLFERLFFPFLHSPAGFLLDEECILSFCKTLPSDSSLATLDNETYSAWNDLSPGHPHLSSSRCHTDGHDLSV